MLCDLFTEVRPDWLEEYGYFCFLDDDIQISTSDINRMFVLSKAFGASISQGSLSLDSFCSG